MNRERILLYYHPGSASLAPHMALGELGLEHELRAVDQTTGAQKHAEYLRLNPHGRIPTLVHGELVLYESAAICLYLADLAPGRLAPAPRSPSRPLLYQWMCFLTNTVQPALMSFHYPEKVHEQPASQRALREHSERWSTELFERLDSELSDRPFLLGAELSICDLFLWMLARWARTFRRPPRDLPRLGAMLRRVLDRPTTARVLESEGLASPFV